jgi:hypothetical protein
MTTRIRILLLFVLVCTSTWPAFATSRERIHVGVRIYDSAGVAPAVWTTALAAAGDILRTANVDVEWLTCLTPVSIGGPSPCAEPSTANQLAVRVVREAALPRRGKNLPLGDALIDLQRGEGTLATVYLDRVVWLARSAGVDAPTLLARAIAHEIGHLLMGTNRHSTRGLLRAVWRRDEVRRGWPGDWQFTAEDGNRIRAGFLHRLQPA